MSEHQPYSVAISCSSQDYAAAMLLNLLLTERGCASVHLYDLESSARENLLHRLYEIYCEAETVVMIQGEAALSAAVATEISAFHQRLRKQRRDSTKRSLMILMGSAAKVPLGLKEDDFPTVRIAEKYWFDRAVRLRKLCPDLWPKARRVSEPVAVSRHLSGTLNEHFVSYDPNHETALQCGAHGAAALFGAYQQIDRGYRMISELETLSSRLDTQAKSGAPVRRALVVRWFRSLLLLLRDKKSDKVVPQGESAAKLFARDLLLLLRFQSYLSYHHVDVDNFRDYFRDLGRLMEQSFTQENSHINPEDLNSFREETEHTRAELKEKFGSLPAMTLPQNAGFTDLSSLTLGTVLPRIGSNR